LIFDNVIIGNRTSGNGGAICCYGGSPSIRNNQISDNLIRDYDYGDGAGIYTRMADVFIEDNTITGNLVGWGGDGPRYNPQRGGGILVDGGSGVVISGNEVAGNRGGGIECYGVIGLIVNDNTVSGNSLISMGSAFDGRLASAGIQLGSRYLTQVCSQVTVSNNVCRTNGGYQGGGILCRANDVTIEDCWLEDNRGGEGGAMYLEGDNITVSNCVLVANFSVAGYGGGIAVIECAPTVENCTIVGNRAGTGQGSALLIRDGAPVVNNCIIGGHNIGTVIECQSTAGSAIPVLSYCDIYNNAGGDWVGCIADQANINGNFSADPLFCDAENGDYHLSVLSPCAASNNSCGSLIGAQDINCGSYVCGDVDLDGELTEADIEALQAAYYHTLPVYFPTPNGDMDCNGTISISDLVILSGYYYGYGPAPCCVPPPKRIDLPGRGANGGPGN
jgi:parallel beta-helix repeat protein